MTRKVLTIILIIIVIINLGGMIYLFTLISGGNKIFYVNTIELFDNFHYKKELEEDFNKVKKSRNNIIDSLNLVLNDIAGKYEKTDDMSKRKEFEDEYSKLSHTINLKMEQFDEENFTLRSKYDQQIWNQLNTYIEDFGKENRCQIILGATGNGSLMYANEGIDITKKLLEYVNDKYQGF